VEIWVCANCRSVNKARAKQCYNCRTPRDLAAVDPNQMEVTGHGKVREVALPPFRSSRGRAVLASIGILVVAGLQIVSVLIATAFLAQLIDGSTSEIKDLTAYLRLIANPDDDPAFIRAITTPKRGVGNSTLEKLATHAGTRNISLFEAAFEPAMIELLLPRQHEDLITFCSFINRMQSRADKEPCNEVMNDLLEAIDYETWLFDSFEPKQAENKWKNVQDFTGWMNRKSEADDKSMIAMTQLIALLNLLESQGKDLDAVSLSTLHASKGLEYGHVYLVGVEEGILPHERSEEPEQVEEERRLMYVGITRAQRSLQISYCTRRKRGKESAGCDPSRFIAELPQDDIVFAGVTQVGSAPAVSKSEGMDKLAKLKAMLGTA
jgi:ATP-dependent DNA helicase Rep